MAMFTSKELYMMNGGQKLYIYKDGFEDVYSATAAEEAAWSEELIHMALEKIAMEQNSSQLESAISCLAYHKYKGLEPLLLKHISDTSPERQIIFAVALWKLAHYKKSFEIIFHVLLQHRIQCLKDVFYGLMI